MADCLRCGAWLREVDTSCVQCGEGRPSSTTSYGPIGTPLDHGIIPSESPHGPIGTPFDHGVIPSKPPHGPIGTQLDHGVMPSKPPHGPTGTPLDNGMTPVDSVHGPAGSPQKYGYVATTMVSDSSNSIAFQKRNVYWLGLMIFLLVLGNTHSWHLTSYTITGEGEDFRGNYTEARTKELEHDLYALTEFSTISIDYAGTENDTSQTNGRYYPTNSEWIDQYDYRTSIETKETTIFLVNIAFFLIGISFIFLLFFGTEQHVRFSISIMSVITGVLMLVALAFFTMNFTPFKDPETSENDENTSFECDDTDSFGIGAFGYVEYTGCDASGFDSSTSTLVPGAGFYEMMLFTTMCFLTPLALPKMRF
jgi:hypothetical protein